jgi:hypothetical protein
VYNSFIKLITNKFFGRKNMTAAAKPVNYTADMVDAMVAEYSANPNKDTVAQLASEFKKTTRSIVAKLVREGVYVATPRVTKTGAPVVRKAAYVTQINDMLGLELSSLEKASKADLEALVSGLNSFFAAR